MRYKKWSQRYIMECYSRDGGKSYMIRDSKCDNRRINVEIIEQEVSDCFRRFIVNAKASERKESKKAATEKEIKKAIIGCIIGDDDNYPFSIKNGHIEGETFFSRVAESLQLRQLVTMSNNKMTEDELTKIIDVLNEQGEDFK